MTVERALLGAFRELGGDACRLVRVAEGSKFVLAEVEDPAGERFGGLVSARAGVTPRRWPASAREAASLCASPDPLAAAVGWATINAVINRPHLGASPADGVDWLLDAGRGRHVAFIGRFPFIEDEVRPEAARLSIFELNPREGELGADAMPDVLPTADLIAVTATTILNRTLDQILGNRGVGSQVLLLGPSTPLAPGLFDLGVSRLAGVVVRDLARVAADVEAGVSFRSVGGTIRVSLAPG
ncbi:MAG: DUF364 domain-containing protein [Acidobacteriota bacterium]